jgi:hypothetical protein
MSHRSSTLVNSAAGELAALVRVKDFRLAVLCQPFLQGLGTKVGAERVRHSPRQRARPTQSMMTTK